MRKKNNFFYPFFIIFFIALLIFLLSSFGVLNSVSSFFGKFLSPIQSLTYSAFHKLPFVSGNSEIKRLRDENIRLLGELLDQKKLQSENSALKDQFAISSPKSTNLLKAKIIGAPGFIPGVTFPTEFILDIGKNDGVLKNQAVVWRNNLVGKIEKTTDYLSEVNLLSSISFSFSAKTEKGVLGVIKGESVGRITLENVLVNEDMRKGDLVFTKGDLDIKGVGIPPDLIVGKIDSIEKNPSALFQKAKVKSLVDFSQLFEVFVVIVQ